MVQSNKYCKSWVVGVTTEVGLTTDQDLVEPWCIRNTTSFIPPRYRKSRGTSHYTKIMNLKKSRRKWVTISVPNSLKDFAETVDNDSLQTATISLSFPICSHQRERTAAIRQSEWQWQMHCISNLRPEILKHCVDWWRWVLEKIVHQKLFITLLIIRINNQAW